METGEIRKGRKHMKKLIAIGEVLIDFIPEQTGCSLEEVVSFRPAIGGAPANVCGAFTKLGGPSALITQVGKDAFGNKIVKELSSFGIETDIILRTSEANTCLAFVSLQKDGNREFSFYRKPSADMLLKPEKIQPIWFQNAFAFHFCSVSLGDYPMLESHKKAIEYALDAQCLISFDPNLRLPLWENHMQLKQRILEFIPYAHILKISDEELEFITGCQTVEEARNILFQGNVALVLYTKGADGAEAYTKTTKAYANGKKVKAVDTTGAGDAFIGSFLAQLARDHVSQETLPLLTSKKLEQYLSFSNCYCAYSVQEKGAIASYADTSQINGF